jgi:Fe2+ transport system protein FeoA
MTPRPRSRMDDPIPLSLIRAGTIVQPVEYLAPGPTTLRLAELGLTPSAEICILRAQPGQPLLLGIGQSRLGLDPELAAQILVRVLQPAAGCRRRRRRGGWRR